MTENQRKRGGCLTTFIIVMIILYAIGAIGLFLAGPLINLYAPEYATGAGSAIFSGVLSLLSIVFLVGVWKYKKWGFYGFVAVSVISIVINIINGGNLLSSIISGILFPAILYFLLRPVWSYME